MLQSDDVTVPNIRVRKFQIDPKFLRSFSTQEVITNCDEIEVESKEDDDDINYDKVLSLVNSKLLLAKTIQIPYYPLSKPPQNWRKFGHLHFLFFLSKMILSLLNLRKLKKNC